MLDSRRLPLASFSHCGSHPVCLEVASVPFRLRPCRKTFLYNSCRRPTPVCYSGSCRRALQSQLHAAGPSAASPWRVATCWMDLQPCVAGCCVFLPLRCLACLRNFVTYFCTVGFQTEACIFLAFWFCVFFFWLLVGVPLFLWSLCLFSSLRRRAPAEGPHF